jgi:hypothetical protein
MTAAVPPPPRCCCTPGSTVTLPPACCAAALQRRRRGQLCATQVLRLRAVSESERVLVVNDKLRIVYASDTLAQLVGSTPSALLQLSLPALIPPPAAQLHKQWAAVRRGAAAASRGGCWELGERHTASRALHGHDITPALTPSAHTTTNTHTHRTWLARARQPAAAVLVASCSCRRLGAARSPCGWRSAPRSRALATTWSGCTSCRCVCVCV